MSSVHRLIGQIINPGVAPRATVRSSPTPRNDEPVSVLLGRIISPPWASQPALGITTALPQPDGDDGTPPVLEVPMPM